MTFITTSDGRVYGHEPIKLVKFKSSNKRRSILLYLMGAISHRHATHFFILVCINTDKK